MIFFIHGACVSPLNPSSNVHETWIDMILLRVLPERHFQVNEKQKHENECQFSCGLKVNSACVIHCIDLCFRKHWISSKRTHTQPEIQLFRTDVSPCFKFTWFGNRYILFVDCCLRGTSRSWMRWLTLLQIWQCCFFNYIPGVFPNFWESLWMHMIFEFICFFGISPEIFFCSIKQRWSVSLFLLEMPCSM